MAGYIPKDFINDLLIRIDIVDIIDEYVPLKRAGKNHQARCPFHEEKTPSFTVNQEKKFYHCFGCGASGTVISFLMEYVGMNFIEAVEELANRAGLEVPRQKGATIRNTEQTSGLYELMELVVDYFRKQLRGHPENKRAIDYLKSRGLTGDLAAKYELGYAPPGWDNLFRAFGNKEAAYAARLEKVGMLLKRDDGGYFDRFRSRIMFPIRDHRGRAIGFGGRIVGDGNPKYLNSPETPIFHKNRELYGLYEASHNQRNLARIYVVEGYMDVLALSQFGIRNSVATLGTAVSSEHLDKLFRYTSELVFCFDGDEAGRKAAWRALELSLPMLRKGRQALFRFMPQGEDPDSYVRNRGRDNFTDNQQTTPLTDYLLSELRSEADVNTREGRASLLEKAIPYTRRLPSGTLKELLIQDLAKIGQIDFETIRAMCQATATRRRTIRPFTPKQKNLSPSLVRKATYLLVHHPYLAGFLDDLDELKAIEQPDVVFLVELLKFIDQREKTTTSQILENWRDTKYENHLHKLIRSEETITDPELQKLEFIAIIGKLMASRRKSRRLQELSTVRDKEELKSIIQALTSEKTDLA